MRVLLLVALLLAAIPATAAVDDAYTVTLLHFDGSIGDESGRSWAAGGDAIATTSTSKFGAGCLYLDGTGDYLVASTSADFSLGTADYTIDMWVQFLSAPVSINTISAHQPGVWADILIGYGGGALGALENSVLTCSSLWSPATSTWYHIALVRASGTTSVYVDGTIIASGSSVADIASTRPMAIGGTYTAAETMRGYIDEVRVSKGVARWSSDFTPPTAAYGPPPAAPVQGLVMAPGGSISFGPGTTSELGVDDSYTVALLHLDLDATDQAGHTFNPMYTFGYTAASQKFGAGAGLGGGATDYLMAADHADWNWPASWTVDAWLRPSSVGWSEGAGTSYWMIWSQNYGASPSHWLAVRHNVATGTELVYGSTWRSADLCGPISVATGTWSHYAAVNDGSVVHLFQDGVEVASAAVSGVPADISATVEVCRAYAVGGTSKQWGGYIDEVRASKGTARWTSGFSVPSSAYRPPVGTNGCITLR